MKFGINFTSCSENGNEIARGVAECYFAVIATTSGIYPLLPVLSQINTMLKSKYLIFKLASTMSSGFLLLQVSHDGIGPTFLCIGRRLNHYS